MNSNDSKDNKKIFISFKPPAKENKRRIFIPLNTSKKEDEKKIFIPIASLINNEELEKDDVIQVNKETNFDEENEFINLNDNTDKMVCDKEEDNSDLSQRNSLYNNFVFVFNEIKSKSKQLKKKNSKKVLNVETLNVKKNKKRLSFRKNYKINVDSDEFGLFLYELNRIALKNLEKNKTKLRKYSNAYKLEKVDNIHINKTLYDKYRNKLNRFAINKLYYKIAPKETKKYKIYKFLVFSTTCLLIVSCTLLGIWLFEGFKIKSLEDNLNDRVRIEEVTEKKDNEEIFIDKNKEKDLYWKYLNTPLSSVNLSELIKENKDTIGWLIVNNTNVDYPVVQTTDNDYYLTHAFDNSKNKAGWVYADFRNSFDEFDKNTIIYAHGRKDKVMFGSLTNTLEKNWYTNSDNQLIQFSTLKYDTMWQIFSIYKIESESYYISTEFESDESYKEFIDTMISRSIYNFNIDVNTNDKILTLSTCYNDYGLRLVVQAKLVKSQKK